MVVVYIEFSIFSRFSPTIVRYGFDDDIFSYFGFYLIVLSLYIWPDLVLLPC